MPINSPFACFHNDQKWKTKWKSKLYNSILSNMWSSKLWSSPWIFKLSNDDYFQQKHHLTFFRDSANHSMYKHILCPQSYTQCNKTIHAVIAWVIHYLHTTVSPVVPYCMYLHTPWEVYLFSIIKCHSHQGTRINSHAVPNNIM